jgi:molybdate/tungstate transport system permease protein
MKNFEPVSIISSISLAFLSLPIIMLIVYGLFVYQSPQAFSKEVMNSIILTLSSSATASFISFLLFTPLAYDLARKKLLIHDILTDIPASIPHPIIGVALLILNSPMTPTGQFLHSIGINFFNTYLGLTIALVLVSAPIYIRTLQSFFESMPRDHEYFALSLGSSRIRILYRVILPNSYKGIILASLISMSRAMSEFGSIVIVAYYVLHYPFYGVSSTSVLIYSYYSYYGAEAAVTTASVMVIVSLPFIILARVIRLYMKN